MIELEYPACPMCGSLALDRSFERAFHPYALARCKSCKFHFLSPRPARSAMLSRYQAASYYQGGQDAGYDDYARSGAALHRTFHPLVRWLECRGLLRGDLLEVGCGHGYVLECVRDRFTRIEATEMAPAAARVAEQ